MNDRSDRGSGEEVTFSFVSPSKTEKISYSKQKQRLIRSLENHEWFEHGILFSTLEKGVMLPIVHMISDDGDDSDTSNKSFGTSKGLNDGYILQQGRYKEIRRMESSASKIQREPSYSSLDRKLRDGPLDGPGACIFLGFKRLESHFNEVLEDSWADWTGARFIYLHMNDGFGLKSLRFFRRMYPNDINFFMYIVFIECSRINPSNHLKILDFVQRFRVEKMNGYVSLYQKYDRKDSLIDGINGIVINDGQHKHRYRQNSENLEDERDERPWGTGHKRNDSTSRSDSPDYRRNSDGASENSMSRYRQHSKDYTRGRERSGSRRNSDVTGVDGRNGDRRYSLGRDDSRDEFNQNSSSRKESYPKTSHHNLRRYSDDVQPSSHARNTHENDINGHSSKSQNYTKRLYYERNSFDDAEFHKTLPAVSNSTKSKKMTTKKHQDGKAFKVLSRT